MTAFPTLSELSSIADTMNLRTTRRMCPTEDVRSEIYAALIMNGVGRPLRGNHALLASLPEPLSGVSAHTGDGQAQESDR